MSFGGVSVVFEQSLKIDWENHQKRTQGISGWQDITEREIRESIIDHEVAHSIVKNYYGFGNTLKHLNMDEFLAEAVELSSGAVNFPSTLATILWHLEKESDGKISSTEPDFLKGYASRNDFFISQIRDIPGVAEILVLTRIKRAMQA